MHPVANIRGSASSHLAGRHVVLGVCGSIAAVKSVELARELIRHGAHVTAVMSGSAMGIVHPEALHFATGQPAITKLTGAVEHVALLGDVPERADLLLVAPATANTIAKIALGIDDSTVTTCATVALGTGVPIVVAPAMHEAMLDHAFVAKHVASLRDAGVAWVEPARDEHKAKLADVDAIVQAVIHRLAAAAGTPPAGQRVLVISGATAQPVDDVRIITNRSSGRSGVILATELQRRGAHVQLWQGHATVSVPGFLERDSTRYATHQDLMDLVEQTDLDDYQQIWMPAAIADYSPIRQEGKIPSEGSMNVHFERVGKVIDAVRQKAPHATLVAFKAESDPATMEARARSRIERYGADFIVANATTAMGATDTEVFLLDKDGGRERLAGSKETVLAAVVQRVSGVNA